MRALAILMLLHGCGPSVAQTTPPSTGPDTGGQDAAGLDRVFGDSPLTPLAREVTALVLAAASSRALPRCRFAIAAGDVEPVRVRGDAVAAELVPTAFLLRLDVADASRRWLRVGLAVTAQGLRVIELSSRDRAAHVVARPAQEHPELSATVRAVLEDARAGRVEERRLTEADRAALGDTVFGSLRAAWVEPDDTVQMDPDAASLVRIAEMAVVARTPEGAVVIAELRVRVSAERIELRADPLVELDAVDPP